MCCASRVKAETTRCAEDAAPERGARPMYLSQVETPPGHLVCTYRDKWVKLEFQQHSRIRMMSGVSPDLTDPPLPDLVEINNSVIVLVVPQWVPQLVCL